jgi:hypothetical protein
MKTAFYCPAEECDSKTIKTLYCAECISKQYLRFHLAHKTYQQQFYEVSRFDEKHLAQKRDRTFSPGLARSSGHVLDDNLSENLDDIDMAEHLQEFFKIAFWTCDGNAEPCCYHQEIVENLVVASNTNSALDSGKALFVSDENDQVFFFVKQQMKLGHYNSLGKSIKSRTEMFSFRMNEEGNYLKPTRLAVLKELASSVLDSYIQF